MLKADNNESHISRQHLIAFYANWKFFVVVLHMAENGLILSHLHSRTPKSLKIKIIFNFEAAFHLKDLGSSGF